jgi:uncharacterized protein
MIRLPECPICGKSVPPASDASAAYAPFCSRRCKEVDLIRWCEGRYAIVEAVDPNRLVGASSEEVESEFDDSSDQGMQGEYEDCDD